MSSHGKGPQDKREHEKHGYFQQMSWCQQWAVPMTHEFPRRKRRRGDDSWDHSKEDKQPYFIFMLTDQIVSLGWRQE